MEFNFIYAEANNPVSIQHRLEDVRSRKIDGLVIKGFLNQDTISASKKKILGSTCEISTVTPYGKIIGKKMSSKNGNFQELPFEEYLENSQQYREIMSSDIGFDFETQFKNACKSFTDTTVDVPSIDNKSYIPASVRNLTPNGGGIIAHVGNEFINKMGEIIELQKIADAYNQLSFFCVVQRPEHGGELVLFDATWEETSGQNLSFEESSEYIKQKKKQAISLEEGDLIIFAAGEIWHEVTPFQGNTNRITIGGFIAPSTTSDLWYFWS